MCPVFPSLYHSHLPHIYTPSSLPAGPRYVLARVSDIRMSIKRDQTGLSSGRAPLLCLALSVVELELELELELPGTFDLSYLWVGLGSSKSK